MTDSSPEAAGFDPQRLERAYALLDHSVSAGHIPAAALTVARHDVALPTRAYGRMIPGRPDSDPVCPDTIFYVASVTKPVTATALMLLVERGQVTLEQPVADILLEFGARGKQRVRLRHLLTHTSGLPDKVPQDIALREAGAPLSEFVRCLYEVGLDFAPGTNLQYQSTGLIAAGAIVERIENVSLPEFLEREFFRPLGMADTALGLRHLPVERLADTNVPAMQRGASWHWNSDYWRNFASSWAGLFTTAPDFARFCRMFLNGGSLDGTRLLSPATVAAMTSDQTSSMSAIPQAIRDRAAWGLGWGMAARRNPLYPWTYFGDLCAPGTYGHGGATGALAWIDPARELTCVLFTTEPATMHNRLLARISNLVSAALL